MRKGWRRWAARAPPDGREKEREGGANEMGVCFFGRVEPLDEFGFARALAPPSAASHLAVLHQRKPGRLDHRQQLLHLGGEDGGLGHGFFCLCFRLGGRFCARAARVEGTWLWWQRLLLVGQL